MKIFTSYILLLSSFTFASQGNDGPCEYGCWGGEIDKDCERGCIQWCEEQDRDSLTTTLSGYGTTHGPWMLNMIMVCWRQKNNDDDFSVDDRFDFFCHHYFR